MFYGVMIDYFLYLLADDLPRRRPPQIYKPPTAEMIAYLDFSVSTTGMLTGVKVRQKRLFFFCLDPTLISTWYKVSSC